MQQQNKIVIRFRRRIGPVYSVSAAGQRSIAFLGIETVHIDRLRTARSLPEFVLCVFVDNEDRQKRPAPTMRFFERVAWKFLAVKTGHVVRKASLSPMHSVNTHDRESGLHVFDDVHRTRQCFVPNDEEVKFSRSDHRYSGAALARPRPAAPFPCFKNLRDCYLLPMSRSYSRESS